MNYKLNSFFKTIFVLPSLKNLKPAGQQTSNSASRQAGRPADQQASKSASRQASRSASQQAGRSLMIAIKLL
ncbi:MAG: hypothetical protein HQK62_14040, partial [Desulfamplus sp.]|nr:hypothetical protein [Desulfamplus sp.]